MLLFIRLMAALWGLLGAVLTSLFLHYFFKGSLTKYVQPSKRRTGG